MASFSSGPIEFTFDGSKLEIRDSVRQRLIRVLGTPEIAELMRLLQVEPMDQAPNRRPTFRFKIPDETKLRVTLTWSARDHQVTPINVSLTGILVRLGTATNGEPELEDLVTVRMSFDNGPPVQCRGIVRRKADREVALLFPDSLDGEHLAPPKRLEQLIMSVQREYLQAQRNADS